MDPAIFIEAEAARLSQCVADAIKSLRESASRLKLQHELAQELTRTGQDTSLAKRQLAALTAAHRLNENLYESALHRLDQAHVDC
jgi:GTP1/Obg family GTP-binding protein